MVWISSRVMCAWQSICSMCAVIRAMSATLASRFMTINNAISSHPAQITKKDRRLLPTVVVPVPATRALINLPRYREPASGHHQRRLETTANPRSETAPNPCGMMAHHRKTEKQCQALHSISPFLSDFAHRVLDFAISDPYDASIMTMEIGCTINRCSSESHSAFFWYYFMVDHPALA